MGFFSWLGQRQRSAPKGRSQRCARKQSPCRPQLEALEDRTTPSGGYLFKTLDDPSEVFGTGANGINDRGQIVGFYADASGQHGFLLSHGQYTTLDAPNATLTIANGINDRGQIVGTFNDASDTGHGFLLSHGQYTILNDPNGIGTFATGINDRGQIVGTFNDASGQPGFLLSGGHYTTLDDPNAVGDEILVNGINDSGKFVGGYSDATGTGHGFLATPTSGSRVVQHH